MAEALRKVFSNRLLEIARNDRDIIALCTDSRGSVTLGAFADALPEQFVEVGIAEQNCVGIAAGLANAGFKPFAAGPASFLSMRSAEQVKVDLAYTHANVKVVGISGGVSYGALGATHHAIQDIALMSAIPGLSVVLPADAYQTRQMTDWLASHQGPVYVRMGRGAVPDVYGKDGISGISPDFVLGKAICAVDAQNPRVLIVATGEMVYHACDLAGRLELASVPARVLDMHTLSPFDEATLLGAARDCELVVTAEEHNINGGLGALTARVLAQTMPKPMICFALPNENLVTGTGREVFEHYGLTGPQMFERVKASLACV